MVDLEIFCLYVMCVIIGVGFYLDRVLLNGFFFLDMVFIVNDVDFVLVVMFLFLVDVLSFFKEKDGFLYSFLDKYLIIILVFLIKN